MSCILCDFCKVEEPKEVIYDHQGAGRQEGKRCQRHQRPVRREILEVDHMAHDREEGEVERQRVKVIEENVKDYDDLRSGGKVSVRTLTIMHRIIQQYAHRCPSVQLLLHYANALQSILTATRDHWLGFLNV